MAVSVRCLKRTEFILIDVFTIPQSANADSSLYTREPVIKTSFASKNHDLYVYWGFFWNMNFITRLPCVKGADAEGG